MHHLRHIKDGIERISTFQNKAHQGMQLAYASVILENIKKNICARLIDDFDAEKYCIETAENQLGNAGSQL